MNKEAYFTPGTLLQQSTAFLDSLGNRRAGHEKQLVPGKSALLVLDMQDYFLDPSSHAYIPSAAAILPGIRQLVSVWIEGNLPVIFTRHLNTPQNARGMAVWWRDLIQESSPLSTITGSLDVTSGMLIEKSQYDAFLGTSLEPELRRLEISQVVICGVMTHLCCESTARSAFMRGFDVFFTVDGTATFTAAFHAATLLNLSHGFAIPLMIDEVVSAVQRDAA